jgi:hypothetical protein
VRVRKRIGSAVMIPAALSTQQHSKQVFERDLWGSYKVIGFQAEKYFARYVENTSWSSS